MLKEGKTTKEIHDSRRRVFKSQRMKHDSEEGGIKWSPDNHSFEKDKIMTTVTEHFRDAYGIELVCNFAANAQYNFCLSLINELYLTCIILKGYQSAHCISRKKHRMATTSICLPIMC